MVRSLWILLLPALLMLGCGGSAPGIQSLPGTEGDFLQAKRAYESGNYIRAVELLSAFLDAHPGSNQLDEVLYLLGGAHQKTGDNLLAVQDYERLIRDFPQSSFREQAEFERAEANYREALKPSLDPEGTETALSLFRAYLIRYPSGTHVEDARAGIEDCLDRLAVKAMLNAETYRRLERPKAEVIYLEKALTTKPDFTRTGKPSPPSAGHTSGLESLTRLGTPGSGCWITRPPNGSGRTRNSRPSGRRRRGPCVTSPQPSERTPRTDAHRLPGRELRPDPPRSSLDSALFA